MTKSQGVQTPSSLATLLPLPHIIWFFFWRVGKLGNYSWPNWKCCMHDIEILVFSLTNSRFSTFAFLTLKKSLCYSLLVMSFNQSFSLQGFWGILINHNTTWGSLNASWEFPSFTCLNTILKESQSIWWSFKTILQVWGIWRTPLTIFLKNWH